MKMVAKAAKQAQEAKAPCPCGLGRYDDCCGRLHAGAQAATAEALMRARYSAFVLQDEGYLLDSWHADTRPASVDFDARRWLGLKVVASAAGGPEDALGTVEFVARYRLGGGRAERLHELSEFVRSDGRWRYRRGLPARD